MKSIKHTYTYKTEYKNENGKLHRINGPACEYADGSRSYYKNGKPHRLSGPSYIQREESKNFYYFIYNKNLKSGQIKKLRQLNDILNQ